jgi:ATP-dependent helicase/nuclease subunit B
MTRTEGHADFAVLEARLFQLIREAKSESGGGTLAPVAIISPSKTLADYLQTLLSEEFGALLGVRIFHHAHLLHQAAEMAGHQRLTVLRRPILESILSQTLKKSGGELGRYAATRPGSVSALLGSMDDLRDAGIGANAALELKQISEHGRRTLELFRGYESRLNELEDAGLTDEAGVRHSSLAAVSSYAKACGFEKIIHYGAYDLTGMTLQIVRALEAAGSGVHYLLPYHPESPAFAFSRRFVSQVLHTEVSTVENLAPTDATARLLGSRLSALYDEESEPLPKIEEDKVSFFHAQGAAAELREVALRILDLHRTRGLALRQIAIVARNLEPYAPLLRRIILEEHRIPFTTHASIGAMREAGAQAAIWLARVIFEDYERQPLMDLFRSGLYRSRDGEQYELAHAWDGLSREFRISSGFEAWTRGLPQWMEKWEPYLPHDADEELAARADRIKNRRKLEAHTLADTVIDLHKSARELKNTSSWVGWAEAMRKLCEELLVGFKPEPGDEADAGVDAVIKALNMMHFQEDAGIPFSEDAALAFFKRTISEDDLPIGSAGGSTNRKDDNGGVRVLDAMQARGLSFDAVFVIGFNADLFPRRPREDAFLRDADRRLLREELKLPLPIKMAGREEEHLILAHILGAARKQMVISWQRADEKGRARVPSLALREVARLTCGAADLSEPGNRALRVMAHPADSFRDAVSRLGILPSESALMGAAFQLKAPARLLDATKELASLIPLESGDLLNAGLNMLSKTESFAPDDLGFDAFVGDQVPPPSSWSPSRLETFGNCPQQYFFRHVLRVEELAEPAEGHEMDVRETGERVHQILHDIYEKLLEGGELSSPGADSREAAARVMNLIGAAWADNTADLAQRMHARYPVLWRSVSEIWKNALQTVLLHDLARLDREGIRVLGLEQQASADIPLTADGESLSLLGRFDRVIRSADGSVLVSDYKSAGNLARHVEPAGMLKGLRLQMPLYVLMAEQLATEWGAEKKGASAEVIGVGPSHVSGSTVGTALEESFSALATLEAGKFEEIRHGFMETLQILHDLAGKGAYPFKEGPRCSYCPYDRACRRLHAPSVTRLAGAHIPRLFMKLNSKSTRAKTIAEAVPGDGEREQDENQTRANKR